MNDLIVLYDGECGFCRVTLALLLKCDRASRLSPVPIQSARGDELLAGIPPRDRLDSWHLIDARGVLHSGGAGIPVVFDALPWAALIARGAARAPTATARAYGWVAGHRTLLGRLLNARTRAWAARAIAQREWASGAAVGRHDDSASKRQATKPIDATRD